MEHLSLSLWEVCNGNLEGGLLDWGLKETCEGRLWKWSISLFIEAP
jgi:hypothetical protein